MHPKKHKHPKYLAAADKLDSIRFDCKPARQPKKAAWAMSLKLSIRQGSKDDLKLILYFIDEAADWLKTKGTDQWAKPWPNERQRDARVERGLVTGRTWMVEDDGFPIGTVTCRAEGNADLWTEQEQAEPALYVTRLIVSRSHKGQGIGAELIDWAGLLAARQWAARWIRMDVWTTNIALHSFYEGRGFEFLRFCEEVEYPSAALFQKPTDRIQAADVRRLADTPDLTGTGTSTG